MAFVILNLLFTLQIATEISGASVEEDVRCQGLEIRNLKANIVYLAGSI